MDDFFTVIKERHSYRGSFADKAVPRQDLEKIIDAGLSAPSGKNEQTTEFVVIDDPLLLHQIGQMHSMQAMHQAKAMIICIIDKDPEPVYHGYSFQVEDCSAAVENMFLALTALGYASVWIDGWLRLEGRAEKIAEIIGLPRGKQVRVLLPVGISRDTVPRLKKKSFERRAWFNRYHGENEKGHAAREND